MKSYVIRAALVSSIGSALLAPETSYSSENGDTVWPLGVQTVLPAILPQPGQTSLYSYTAFYKANSYRDNHGDSAIPDFKLENFIQAVRVVHTWDVKLDSGITLSSGVIGSANKIKVEAFGNSDTDTGFRQLYLTPLYVGYSPSENLHLLTGFSAFVPLGSYDGSKLANSPTPNASYTQEFDLTWFPSPNWEVSIAPTFTVNAKSDDTDYRSGNIFNIDYLLGYRLESNPKVQLGLVGYYTHQVTDDRSDLVELEDGNRLRKFAVGPQVFYAFDQTSGVVLKWMHETSVKNGPKGDSLWLEFAFPL
ncbi:SphA family protein [Pseudomonas sp. Marseille-P9899]|uniref:SphA family protein n=1 Tax=Pseudomonas sp. Marseille-P9899 TaxID=2730401 RepID=UPI00158F64D3|nr:transporter [Pseudomonas sp. Marseille-P9899]